MNSKLFRNYGYLLNHKPFFQNIFFSIFLIFVATKDINERKCLFVTFTILLGIVTILKTTFKINRPCYNNFNWCPKSYDFPSGHSTMAMFWLPFFINKSDNLSKSISIYLLFMPISRVIAGVHSWRAVIFGSIIGLSMHYVYKHLINN